MHAMHRNTFETLESRTLLAAAPQIVAANITPDNIITLTSSIDLAPATVNASSVRVFTVGPDGVLNTADDTNIGATVTYNANTRAIRITTSLPPHSYYRVHLDASIIRSIDNVALDGEIVSTAGRSGDGQPGGDYNLVRQTIARFHTIAGDIDVRLFGDRTPITVQNFVRYAEGTGASNYDNTFFHRSIPGFVIQGGGFLADGTFDDIPDLGFIQNEPGISNIRGTIAMAKISGNPNSASSEFFFNLADNSDNLDNQNGGFTVFGEVIDQRSLDVMDRIAAFPVETRFASPFSNLPVVDRDAITNRGLTVIPSDLIRINGVEILTRNSAPNPWQVGAVADFDGDGDADIMWRNYDTGENVLWVMQGNTRVATRQYQPLNNTAWQLAGAADFNKDGHVDLLWRNLVTGQNTIAFTNASRQFQGFQATHSIANFSWALEGLGDLDGDGHVDLVWRNYDNGRNVVWFMNQAVASHDRMRALPPVVNTAFHLGAVTDVNGDGYADLVFRNTTTGAMSLWTMIGNSVSAFRGMVFRVDQNWKLVAGGRFDSPGGDLLWTNPTTGANEVWTLDPVGGVSSILPLPATPT